MAITKTALGLTKVDRYELAENGHQVISENAQKTDDLISAAVAVQQNLAARLGRAEANIRGGLGADIGLSEDPLNPGTYFMADTSPIQPDPDNPGLYTF